MISKILFGKNCIEYEPLSKEEYTCTADIGKIKIIKGELFGERLHVEISDSDPGYQIDVSDLNLGFIEDVPAPPIIRSRLELLTLIKDKKKIDELPEWAKRVQENERDIYSLPEDDDGPTEEDLTYWKNAEVLTI